MNFKMETKIKILTTVENLLIIPLISAAFYYYYIAGIFCLCGYFLTKIVILWFE